jgi:hypothetical protein
MFFQDEVYICALARHLCLTLCAHGHAHYEVHVHDDMNMHDNVYVHAHDEV